MRASFRDIRSSVLKDPLWYDENGVPRYLPHHPSASPNIYAREVVFFRIACQACLQKFDVQLASSTTDLHHLCYVLHGPEEGKDERAAIMQKGFLRHSVEVGSLHYGDPPSHDEESGEYCHAGCTMNCYDLKVLEFWTRNDHGWARVPVLEIDLPDSQLEEFR